MSCMPPASTGSGPSPADPDQPTQAPPRPATKGSSAVTSPPGLRWYPIVPSDSVTWSTGSRLATTTTGLSAATGCLRSLLDAVPRRSDPRRRRRGPAHPAFRGRATQQVDGAGHGGLRPDAPAATLLGPQGVDHPGEVGKVWPNTSRPQPGPVPRGTAARHGTRPASVAEGEERA